MDIGLGARAMRIPVLIQPVPGIGFQARGGEPFALTAEGSTREEALRQLREMIVQQIDAGAEVTTLEVSDTGSSSPISPGLEPPWAPFAGMFQDDPLFDEWQEAIAEYRQRVEEDPDVP
jgi:hypothetical protein